MKTYPEVILLLMKLFYRKLFFCSLISFVFFYSATAQNKQESINSRANSNRRLVERDMQRAAGQLPYQRETFQRFAI